MTGRSIRAGLFYALLTALLLWLGLPGGGEFWPVLFIALLPLLFLINNESTKHRILLGLVAGFFHFMFQLYWIVIVLGRYGGLPWFFSVPAFLLLSFYMACYFSLFVAVAGYLRKRVPLHIVLWVLPVLWVGLDWLRSFLFSGFPWMDLGYGLWQVTSLIQVADLFGHHFLTWLIVLVNCLIFYLMQRQDSRKIWSAVAVIGIAAAVILYGNGRKEKIDHVIAQSDPAEIGIVQGNIDQSKKWSPEYQRRTLDIYLQQSRKLLEGKKVPQLIVWPETALPFFPMRSSLFNEIQNFASHNEANVLTGSPWFVIKDETKRDIDLYNSAFLITHQGDIGDMYFKSHLVPYGEYVPLKKFMPFLAPLVEAAGDFSPGVVDKPLSVEKIRAGVLICFESIFPEIGRKWVKNGANVLVNLTNDAWYGRSSAPEQSMAMSVFRAVETRRSLVRSANTGISAFVDPAGRVMSSSDIFVTWAKSQAVVLMDISSFYCRYGYLFAPLCFLLSLAVIVTARKISANL